MRDTLDAARLLSALGAAVGFALLTREVAGRDGIRFDRTVRRRVQRHRSPPLDVAARALTTPGRPWAYIPAAVLIGWRLRRRGAVGAGAVVAAALAGWVSHHAVKLRVRRRRPPTQRGQHNYFEAFPSGHTTPITAIALTTAYMCAREGLVPAAGAGAAALGTAAIIGATRVYLDEHWATDVVGAWALGAVVATLCGAGYDARERRAPRIMSRVNRLRRRG